MKQEKRKTEERGQRMDRIVRIFRCWAKEVVGCDGESRRYETIGANKEHNESGSLCGGGPWGSF